MKKQGKRLPRKTLVADARDYNQTADLINRTAINPTAPFEGIQNVSEMEFNVPERLREIQESEERFQSLFDNASDLIYVHDLKGNYISINRAAERAFGYSREEALKLNLKTIVAPEHLKLARRMLAEKIAGAHQTVYELDCITKAGQRITLEINSTAIYKNGVPVAVQGIARDITERKRTEQALKESEERYRDLFENANDLIYTHDLRGNFTSLNRAGEIITGYSREEALEMNISQVVAPEFLEAARQMTMRKIKGEPPTSYELEIIAKNGQRVPLELSTRLVRKDGVPIAVQGIGRDITERRRAEKAARQSAKQLALVTDTVPVYIAQCDAESRYKFVNKAYAARFGLKPEDCIGKKIEEIVGKEAYATFHKYVDKILSGVPVEFELEIPYSKIGKHFMHCSYVPEFDENNTVVGWVAAINDISERKRAEEALIASEQRFRLLGEGVMHQVWTSQPDGKLDYVNQRTADYFGRTVEYLVGEGWRDVVHPEDLPECLRCWKHSLETGEPYEFEFRLRRKDGQYRWHLARATAGRDADGKIIKWFGTSTDIHEQKNAEAKLNHYAKHDALTNLANRPEFINQLRAAIKQAEREPSFHFAVLFLDLDRFKVVNDSLGHAVGDKLLVAIAERIRACVRPRDVVARLGGDEFTVLLNKTGSRDDVVTVAERIQRSLSEPFKLDNYEIFTSASIGVIMSDDARRAPEEYLRDADAAMYRAKEAGKARYEIFDREMHIRNMNLLRVETDLRHALERKEFEVVYQPIISLQNGDITEFEALIRWRHPVHGLISPNDFIGVAEETGLIVPIGRWILEEACRQTREWQKRFPLYNALSVCVNLSARQLKHPALYSQIVEILDRTGLSPRHLKLEVTETTVMEHSDIALEVLQQLRELGISLSTDDFGTGYSSLSYLHRFPFQRLKIDRSFIGRIDTDAKSQAIVRTILMLGQNLNIETVAEGIETERQMEILRWHGCESGQGYLISKPVDPEAAQNILRDGLETIKIAPFFGLGRTLEVEEVQ
jgi:diguanylate cyclase (GGDEF)-like protein/PAS domain S-box-containing protein